MSIVACISVSSWMTDIPYTTGGFEMIWLRPSKKFTRISPEGPQPNPSHHGIYGIHTGDPEHELLLFEPTTWTDPSTVVGCRYTVYGIVHRFADLGDIRAHGIRYTSREIRPPAWLADRGTRARPATENKNIFLRDPATSVEKRGTHPLWPGKP